MNHAILIDGITKRERHQVTLEIQEAISAGGGWIEDENFLSNKAVVIRFFTPHRGFAVLRDAIQASDIRLDDESAARLEKAITGLPPTDGEVEAAITITFSHDERDIKREIPAVPG